MNNSFATVLAGTAALTLLAACASSTGVNTEQLMTQKSANMVAAGPWPSGDQRGMANTLGAGTWSRCGHYLADPGAQSYELSHVRANDMTQSPFGAPLIYEYRPTVGIPGTRHAFNGEQIVTGEPGAQGTQLDALGHFAFLDSTWDGSSPFPGDNAKYYGGYDQQQVKPTADSPLLKLGIEQVPPIVTSAVLLDARAYLGGGKALTDGQRITADNITAMLKAQGLGWRGLMAGDVLYIYTGWSDIWTSDEYYTKGPGLSYDAALMIEKSQVVLVGLDNPFTDPVSEGALAGKAPPPEGTPTGLPFAIHHHNLTQSGIHQIQNMNLKELAQDQVWLSCTMILPLRSKGASGSPVRPVAIGSSRG